ncbi:SAC3/GANP domain protein [Aspergillus clavatus NRRL 1]|uniref:SAC3/GANP domain protein n=1 Tax=Aspergillus clavatus (strain ATCC 1007 / CBS 513.65 / DSM 816 / NCTC 3887 / NRRL 1 / QM 1276 / 107) TaxID=344612 RepID=A1C957_ASPCL|nr:SAC3/GANP domain protein [Aspergillus clavatus NRRL 1]EAW13381.1 SAC3/GANP domain protein [Aspergillus clavatus NRRL 1]
MSSIPPWRATASATATAPFHGHATPAYIPVQARRSFAHTAATNSAPSVTTQPKPSTTPAPSRKRVEWPAPLRSYVQRSFAPEHQIPGVERQEMETKLKTVITEAAEKEQLETINWDALPLPQVMIQNERNKILTNPAVSGWSASLVATAQKPATEDASKKRKSTEYSHGDKDSCPPWRQTNNNLALEDRTTYASADKRQRIDYKNPSKSKANLEMRKKRFEESRARFGSSPSSSRDDSPSPGANQGPVVGRCQDLEKNYFRLTSAPNPDTVRPLPVLYQTLDLLKKKWKKDNNYGYICDQFKSLRQDLTVQRIRNEFTVSVYEIHARIALEKGDLGEYNQCQTQLRALYAQNLGGHPTEFKAYRILYFIHTRNWTAMNDALADLTAADKRDPAVKHALDVRSALALGNYHRFFQLYLDTPNMGAYLMDMFVDRERLSALAAICKAYKPDVKIRFITEELGFESDEQSARFILDHTSDDMLQERDGSVRLVTGGKAGQLFEAAKAEAHRVVDIKGQI